MNNKIIKRLLLSVFVIAFLINLDLAVGDPLASISSEAIAQTTSESTGSGCMLIVVITTNTVFHDINWKCNGEDAGYPAGFYSVEQHINICSTGGVLTSCQSGIRKFVRDNDVLLCLDEDLETYPC